MNLNPAIHCSQNILLIHLDQVSMEEIVEEKLLYFLNRKTLGKNILKDFYEPPEQALIEFKLKQMKGNQLKTAKVLGINRNTLKKKIVNYNLNIKKLLSQKKPSRFLQSRIFLSSIASLDLLSVCRAKWKEASFQDTILKDNMLKRVCQPVEKRIIQQVLEYCKGNHIRASHHLGINRNTLKQKMNLNFEA